MRVVVTAKDIQDGERGNSTRCPIALALRRQTGEEWEVQRRTCYAAARPGVLVLSAEAQRFIRDYDHGRAVTPRAFELVA